MSVVAGSGLKFSLKGVASAAPPATESSQSQSQSFSAPAPPTSRRSRVSSASAALKRSRDAALISDSDTDNPIELEDEFERDSDNIADVDSDIDDERIARKAGDLLIPRARDFSRLVMKADADRRPIWVCPNGRVFLEKASPIYKPAYDFLIAVSEPVCRPQFIHEYQITSYSLYAAASLGLQTEDIVAGLRKLSKVELDLSLIDWIGQKTLKCGKLKLLLRKTRYFVESIYPDVLQDILRNPVISQARIDNRREELAAQRAAKLAEMQAADAANKSTLYYDREQSLAASRSAARLLEDANDDMKESRDPATGFLMASAPEADDQLMLPGTKNRKADQRAAMGLDDVEALASDEAAPPVLSFEVDAAQVENVRKECSIMEYPMLEEYDFRRDNSSTELPINLRPSTLIREYQEKALSKMFGNGRARSGIIVLPCGAGKTLVGITAAATIKKSTLVFCTTGVAVDQWRRQFLHWSTLPAKYICTFTSSVKDKPVTDALVLITTYNMVSFTGKRSAQAEEVMNLITTQEWGLVLCDEVHVTPAKMFRKSLSNTHSRCKMGLTATLVREDNLVEDLFYLLGPKLYEANWLDLQTAGHLATVQCVEVHCPMPNEFYTAYLNANLHKQLLLYVMNPNKFRACEYLIRLHEARGDKVLVFSDNVFALRTYALALGKPLIYGQTTDSERLQFLHHFQHDPKMGCLFISKVGDNSIDLPDVNVIIQISSHFASRRQEAQRLGRILRPKSAATGRFNAFFYTLVSTDTKEMFYSGKRQRFLVDQGYAFKVVTELPLSNYPDLHFTKRADQHELLAKIMAAEDAAAHEEAEAEDPFEYLANRQKKRVAADRKRGNLQALSGADDRAYLEFQKRDEERKEKEKKEKARSSLFKAREKDIKEAAKNRRIY